MKGSGVTESEQAANARKVDVDWSFQQVGAMAVVVPQEIDDEHGGHVQARECSGPPGADGAHGGRAPFAVDEHPVADGVDDVGGDEREGHDADHVHGLQATAHREVEQ